MLSNNIQMSVLKYLFIFHVEEKCEKDPYNVTISFWKESDIGQLTEVRKCI